MKEKAISLRQLPATPYRPAAQLRDGRGCASPAAKAGEGRGFRRPAEPGAATQDAADSTGGMSDEEFARQLADIYAEFAAGQEPLGAEFAAVLEEHIDELYES